MIAGRVEAHFFTATILEWKHLLKPARYKDIIIDSLRFLLKDGRVYVLAFVIMDNHIHIIWHIREGHRRETVQQSLLKYTAQQIRFDLAANHPAVLERFRVDASDRNYQIWERNALSVDLFSPPVLLQKLHYLHQNPVRAGLCHQAEDYYYSSASYYETGIDVFGFLSRYE